MQAKFHQNRVRDKGRETWFAKLSNCIKRDRDVRSKNIDEVKSSKWRLPLKKFRIPPYWAVKDHLWVAHASKEQCVARSERYRGLFRATVSWSDTTHNYRNIRLRSRWKSFYHSAFFNSQQFHQKFSIKSKKGYLPSAWINPNLVFVDGLG